ncbi:unnamed protein product [Meganyctiphanes norvegica]|uniref:Reverse transcriptase domain-containing protein n=1 Tax=Meganyctiphanes norvegica TaxID=48144 RepID=A0AAV2STE7_MEGNR
MLQFAVEGVLKGKINREESMLNHALSKQDWDKRRRKFKDTKSNVVKGMVVVALDYSKAYDSVNRKSLIETLIKYKIDPKVIDLIYKIYRKDTTLIKFMDEEEEIEITSGIRQGCTLSTELFKLVTYEIMEKLDEEGEDFIVEDVIMNSLFFADDSLILARTVEEAKKN